MQLKIRSLKRLIESKILLALCMAMITGLEAQVVIDSTNAIQPEIKIAESDTVKKPFKRFKAEGVSAVIGEFVVLDSDIDKSYLELTQQGISIEDVTRCQLLGKLMEDKLYAHHAKVDSLEVNDAEISARIEQQLQYIVGEFGGDEEKVIKFYKKNSMEELRQELFRTNKTLMLAGEMQRKVVEGVEVTPEEVREFFFAIPEEERPVFSAEVEVAQIIVQPKVSESAKQKVIDRLYEFR